MVVALADADIGGTVDYSKLKQDPLFKAIDLSHDNLWGKHKTTVKERFGNTSGRVLWLLFRKIYIKGRYHYEYYSEDGRRLLSRSLLVNDRREEQVIQVYKPGMRSGGFNWEHRSSVVLVDFEGKFHTDARQILGGGHCVEAVCECHEEDLMKGITNEQIQASIREGLDAYEVKMETPEEIQLAIVDMLNEQLLASGTNIRQVFQQRERLWERFQRYKGPQTIAQLGGQSAYDTFLRNWLKTKSDCTIFGTRFDYFSDVGSLCVKLKEANKFDQFMEVCQTFIDNIGRTISLEAIVRNIAYFDRLFRKHYSQSMTERRFNNFWWEGVIGLLPIKNNPYVCHRLCVESHSEGIIARVKLNMRSAKTLELKVKHKTVKAAKDAKVKENNCNKDGNGGDGQTQDKKRKGDGQSKAGKKKPKFDKTEDVVKDEQKDGFNNAIGQTEQVFKQTKGAVKEMEWADDCSWCIDQACILLRSYGLDPDKALELPIRQSIRAGYQLLWTGNTTMVSFDGSIKPVVRKWSALKNCLCET